MYAYLYRILCVRKSLCLTNFTWVLQFEWKLKFLFQSYRRWTSFLPCLVQYDIIHPQRKFIRQTDDFWFWEQCPHFEFWCLNRSCNLIDWFGIIIIGKSCPIKSYWLDSCEPGAFIPIGKTSKIAHLDLLSFLLKEKLNLMSCFFGALLMLWHV